MDNWDFESFMIGAGVMFLVMLVGLGFCAEINTEYGWNIGYLSGQVDALNSRIVVVKETRPDNTTYWAASQPVEMDKRDYVSYPKK